MNDGIYDAYSSEDSAYNCTNVYHEHSNALSVLGKAHSQRRELIVEFKYVISCPKISMVICCQLVNVIQIASDVLEVRRNSNQVEVGFY